MQNQDFSLHFLVDQSPKEVYDAVVNVRGWWSKEVEGNTNKLQDEFVYRHKDLHYSKQRVVEVIPNEKVVWLVTDSELSFTQKKNEWTNTLVRFEISRQGNKTQLLFTHVGLSPKIECFNDCSNGWNHYLKQSLLPLITTGEGRPD
jgi:hypothetical protein